MEVDGHDSHTDIVVGARTHGSIVNNLPPINPDEDLMRFVSLEGGKLRILFETLSNVLVDGTINFSSSGIVIEQTTTIDWLVQVRMEAENIQPYYCKEEIPIGVNFPRLFACMKNAGKDDVIVLRLTKKSWKSAQPSLIMDQISADATYSFSINLLDIDSEVYNIPMKQIDACVTLQSAIFSRIVRCCSAQGTSVQIMTGNGVIKFGSRGDLFSQCCITIPCADVTRLQGRYVYSVNSFTHVSKASTMGNCVKMMLTQDYPLLLECSIGTMGIIRFFVSPQNLDEEDENSLPSTIEEMDY